MRKLLLATLLFSFCGSQIFSQNQIDSLQNLVKNAPEDTQLVWQLRHLYRAIFAEGGRDDEALATAQQGLELARKLNFEKGIDYFLFYNATALDALGRGREAIPFFEESIELNQKSGDSLGLADNLTNLGVTFFQLGDYEKCLEKYVSAYQIYERLGERDHLAKSLNNIGVVYRQQENLPKALEFYQKSLEIKLQIRDSLGIAASHQNIGAIQNLLKNESESTRNLRVALEIYQKLQRPKDEAGVRVSLAEVFFDHQKITAAKSELEQAFKFYEKTTDPELTPTAFGLVGKIALRENNPTGAESALKTGLELTRKFGQLDAELDLLILLAEAQEKLGKPAEALASMHQIAAIRDTMTERTRLQMIENSQARFETLLKDKDLKISQLALKQKTWQSQILMVGAGLLALLAAFIFFSLRQRIRFNKKLAAQESELQKQQIQSLENEKQLAALDALFEGQEAERSRIAADLHDGLGGLLASVKSHFTSLDFSKNQQPLSQKTEQLIDDACGEVRRISHNLMPRALAVAGLPDAVEDLAMDLKKSGIEVDFEIAGFGDSTPPLDPHRATMIYRVIQELLHNVVKHADARHLLLQIFRQPSGALTIIVEDDGRGFDFSEAKKKAGLGLSGIESRVQFLGGAVVWDAVLGSGTSVCVDLPAV